MAQVQKDPLSLRLGYWVAVHGAQLRTWWAISIIVADIALIGVFAVTFAGYSFSTLRTVRGVAAMSETLVGPDLRQRLTPTELVTGDAVALPRGEGRYDLVVPVSNPNTAWAATQIRYNFTFGAETREETVSLWPGQEGYLMQLNVAGPTDPDNAPLTANLNHVSWQRPESLKIFQDVKFPLTEGKLSPVTGLTSGGSATRYSAKVKNDSVYGFKKVRFGIVLKNGSALIAANETVIANFPSFDERLLEATWLRGLPLAAEAVVFPIVDLLDPATFLETK